MNADRGKLKRGQPTADSRQPTADSRQPTKDVGQQGRISEPAFNVELGSVLWKKHPRWPDCIGVEQTGVLREGPRLKPDIVIRHPGGLPVVVETEYAPAHTVEADARARLGKTLQSDGRRIEQSIALRIPDSLSAVSQHHLRQSIAAALLEFCVFSGDPDSPVRWPEAGWIQGGVDDLAICIELAAMSEDRIAQGLGILEVGISQAARILRDGCADTPAPLGRIAKGLHQQDGVQTTRMAMAIVANALTFHTAIAGSSTHTAPCPRSPPRRTASRATRSSASHAVNAVSHCDRVPARGVRALRSTRLPAGRAGTFRLPRRAA